MELTEQKVYEALGVKPKSAPHEEGGGEQTPAAPPTEQREPSPAEQGGKAPKGHELPVNGKAANGQPKQEPADPAKAEMEAQDGEREEHPGSAGPAGGLEAPPEESGGKPDETSPVQSLEQRREAAAARRRAEQQAAIDEAVRRALQEERDRAKVETAAFFKRAQLKNTITGEPITTMEEFDAWEKAFSASRLQRELKEGKLTPESLEAVIAENPVVKRAQELIQRQEETARAAEASAAKARVDAELLEIQKLDPSIRSVEDLLHMPKAKEFYELVQSGNSFLNAFRLANYERLTAQAAEAARQQAQNLTRSKEHLTRTDGQRGGGAVSVPPDELRLFREMNPGASEAEIQAYYNKYKGSN